MTPGLGLVMEIVRLSVNKQFPQLMPSLYPGELATRSQHFGSVDVMWLPLGTLENINTLNINGAKLFAVPAVSEGRVSAPSGPPPAAPGRRQGRATLQTSAWATGSPRNPVIMNISRDPTDSWVSSSYSLWPLAHCHEVCTVIDTFSTDDPTLWSSLLSPTARAAAFCDNQGHCHNCHEMTQYFWHVFLMLASASTPSAISAGTAAPRTAAGKDACCAAAATEQEDPEPALARAAATVQAGNTVEVGHTTPTPVTIRKTRVHDFHGRGRATATVKTPIAQP